MWVTETELLEALHDEQWRTAREIVREIALKKGYGRIRRFFLHVSCYVLLVSAVRNRCADERVQRSRHSQYLLTKRGASYLYWLKRPEVLRE